MNQVFCTLVFASQILFTCKVSGDEIRLSELIVWNVGQGSWATVVDREACLHFDLGGEHAPLEAIASNCRQKTNFVYYSHWDWDHIGLTRAAQSVLPDLCVVERPGGESTAANKLRMLAELRDCAERKQTTGPFRVSAPTRVTELRHLNSPPTANGQSRVFLFRGVIFPGDSPSTQEKVWGPFARSAHILIAGHHGSKTSTSLRLLAELKSVRQIVVSARREKYGHPHRAMLDRAYEGRFAVLTTEDWGSIHIGLSNDRFAGEPATYEKPRSAMRRKIQTMYRK